MKTAENTDVQDALISSGFPLAQKSRCLANLVIR